ncbi:MAG: hypothetical protein KAH54_05130 [Candidatus Sabulitectum sp.]|nr:hypothetical protein [Candidatus Sabulitectum sp.]
MPVNPLELSFLEELRLVLTVQNSVISKASARLDVLDQRVMDPVSQLKDLKALAKSLEEIECQSDYLQLADLDEAGLSDEQLHMIFQKREQHYTDSIHTTRYTSWSGFVRDSIAYCAQDGIEELLPWDSFLAEADFARIKSESYSSQYRWDKWDYSFVGLAGVLGALTDIFLVKIPKTMTAGQYAGQKGSPITETLRKIKFPDSMQNWLERVSKVPYDHTGGGDHRIDTFGHDPVLGFIIGVLDIMRGGVSSIKGGKIAIEAGGAQIIGNPLEALLRQFLHMCSDVATSKGLPVPFASMFRSLRVGNFVGPTGRKHSISSLTGWMYHYGYDLRHFLTMSITPATIEIVLRAYLMLRHFAEHGEVSFTLAKNPKYRSMLLSAHAIACATNAGKVALQQGNPLAINYAEWLALLRYLIPSLKYWIFDRKGLELEHLEAINDSGWNEILLSSDALLTKLYRRDLKMISIG